MVLVLLATSNQLSLSGSPRTFNLRNFADEGMAIEAYEYQSHMSIMPCTIEDDDKKAICIYYV